MKKFLIGMLMIVMSVTLFACESKEDGGNNKQYKYYLNVNYASLTLEKDEQTVLVANYTDNKTKVIFSSTDEAVATVDKNGKITAIGCGTCYIIASANGQEKACAITVIAPEYTIELVYSDADYFLVGAKSMISALTYKNGVKYDDEISWSVSGSSGYSLEILDNENVVFSADKAGAYVVKAETAKASAQCIVQVIEIGG